LKTGALASTRNLFLQVYNEKKLEKNQHMCDQLHLLVAILAQWQRLVASTKALDLLHWAMRAVFYWRTTAAIKMASKVGLFFCHCVICCCPGGRWGNTEQGAAQWQHPVASQIALDMLHWAMPSVLLRRTARAIKTANNGGAFVFCRPFFCLP
jgi:hypothetical protein